MVSRFVADNACVFSPPMSGNLVSIWEKITEEINPMIEFQDEVVWTVENNGTFSLKFSCHITSEHSRFVVTHWVD